MKTILGIVIIAIGIVIAAALDFSIIGCCIGLAGIILGGKVTASK